MVGCTYRLDKEYIVIYTIYSKIYDTRFVCNELELSV